MQSVKSGGAQVVVVDSLEGYPGGVAGDVIIIQDTGDETLNALLIAALHARAREARGQSRPLRPILL